MHDLIGTSALHSIENWFSALQSISSGDGGNACKVGSQRLVRNHRKCNSVGSCTLVLDVEAALWYFKTVHGIHAQKDEILCHAHARILSLQITPSHMLHLPLKNSKSHNSKKRRRRLTVYIWSPEWLQRIYDIDADTYLQHTVDLPMRC